MELKELSVHLPSSEIASIRHSDGIPYISYSELMKLYPEEKVIGHGASGEVYTSGQFAIKRFYDDPRLLELNTELNIYASVKHKCIIKPIAWSVSDNIGYLLMPMGENIGTAYKNNKITFYEIISDTLSAVAFLNSVGIAHADIKPENIVFHKGKAKLIDMGSARYGELNIDGKYYINNIAYTDYSLDPEYSYQQYNNINCEVYALAVTYTTLLIPQSISFGSVYHYYKKIKTRDIIDFIDTALKPVNSRPNAEELLAQSPLIVRRYVGILFEENVSDLPCNIKGMKYIIKVLYNLNVKAEVLFLALHLLQRTYKDFSKVNNEKLYAMVIMNLATEIVPTFYLYNIREWKEFFTDKDTEEEFAIKFRNMKVEVLKSIKGIVMTKTPWHYAKSANDLLPLLRDVVFGCDDFTREITDGPDKCILVNEFLTEEQAMNFSPLLEEKELKEKFKKVYGCELNTSSDIELVEELFSEGDWKRVKYIQSIPILIHNRSKLYILNLDSSLTIYRDLLDNFPNEEVATLVLDRISIFDWRKYGSKVLRLGIHPFQTGNEELLYI